MSEETSKVVIAVSAIVAAVVLIITGNGMWVIGALLATFMIFNN